MPDLAIMPEESGDIYERFSRYVNRNQIQKNSFCKSCNLYLNMDELRLCFEVVKFKITHDEIT